MPKTLSFLARRVAAGLIAAPLMLGAVSLQAFVASTPASAAAYAVHGAWQSFSLATSRGTLFGAMTQMSKGGTAAFIIGGDSISMVLVDPSWDFVTSREAPVRVQIDGGALTGVAIINEGNRIEMHGITSEALKELVAGAEAVINIDHGYIVWSIDLHGFTAAMADAMKLYKASY
jgi:hypothetical protein